MSEELHVERKGPLIGCTSVVMADYRKIVAIKCSKGRGLILPGGKHEPGKDKSFAETSRRELFEEAGLTPTHTSYIWAGLNTDGYYVYSFRQIGCNLANLKGSSEGEAVIVDIEELKGGRFWPYYETLFMAMNLHF